jgi:pyruvate kinase
MRRTRIISTVGPAANSPDLLRSLILAGTDAFRLNFSHGTREEHAAVCARIRSAAADVDRPIAVLQDLAGPKIRIGALERPIDLTANQVVMIEFNPDYDYPAAGGRVTTAFAALFTSVEPGVRLLVDEGRIELEVLGASSNRIDARVLTAGRLDSHKGINVPGVILQTPAMTEKDEADLRAGIAMGVDVVGVSFVQGPDAMRRVRAAAVAAGAPDLPLVAKIEKPLAVDRLEDIIEQSDGLMVARGDLGIEMPLEVIPAVQKRVITAARDYGIPVTVATQVLESMRSSPRPTRAEVTDAAHAVDEGADAVMLAGETAIGRYPIESVTTLDRILQEAERAPAAPAAIAHLHADWAPHARALCEAAVALASRAGAAAIVAVTEGGRTARVLSALRPRARILAAASTPAIAARLNIVWGVTSFVAPSDPLEARRLLVDRGLVAQGSVVVFVSIGTALGRSDANFVHVETL